MKNNFQEDEDRNLRTPSPPKRFYTTDHFLDDIDEQPNVQEELSVV